MRRAHLMVSLLLLASLAACQRRRVAPGPPAVAPAPTSAAAQADVVVDPAAEERASVMKKVAAVFACFEDGLRDSGKAPGRGGYRRTSFSDVFLFDELFGTRGRIAESEGALCAGALRRHRQLAAGATTGAGSGRQPTPASQLAALEAQPAFIRAAGGRTALNLLEHAELTRAALAQMTGARERPVFDSVSYGALLSDLYRWSDLRYHAQTEAFEPHLRASETATAQEAFVGFVAGVLNDFNEQLRQRSFDRAALFLGIACHAAQDLVTHRGMTRRQLAGLRFFADSDLYGSDAASARRDEAQAWTVAMLKLARAAIGDETLWRRFLAWSPPPGFDLDNAARGIFQDTPQTLRLSYAALTSHWSSQLVYRRSPDARQELAAGASGLIRWEVAPLFQRIRSTVENGGIALAPPQARR